MNRIGKFDKVTISTDGPDVLLQLPDRFTRAHWSDFAQIEQGIMLAIRQCQDWEKRTSVNGGEKQ